MDIKVVLATLKPRFLQVYLANSLHFAHPKHAKEMDLLPAMLFKPQDVSLPLKLID